MPAFIAGPARTYSFGKSTLVEANGAPAAWMTMDGQPQPVLCDGRIHAFSRVLTPDKFGRIRPVSRHRGH
ncbi:hypothetical protein [Streptosporangium sp. NPDC002607]